MGLGPRPFDGVHAGVELLDVFPHLRQLAHGRELQLAVAKFDGWLAQHRDSRRHIVRHARPGSKDRLVADVHVVANTHLPGHHDPVARGRAARHTHLRTDHVVAAESAVVGDHHEVIELRAVANRRCPVGTAVDRGAGTDLNIVAHLDPAQLRRERVAATHHLVTEAIGSKHGTGMDHAPCPHLRAVVEHRIREDHGAGTNPGAGHDLSARVDCGAGPDLHVGTDDGKRVNIDIRADADRGIDDSPRADADAGGRAGRPQAGDHRGKRRMHVGHLDRGPIEWA